MRTLLHQTLLLLLACLCLPLVTQASDLDGVLPNGNTADGDGVLFSRTTGIANSGFGFQSLFHDTTGSYNTATGYRALFNDSSGYSNTADGYEALYSDTTAIRNTAVGAGTLLHNNASANTAVGWAALYSNTTGPDGTAIGYQALYHNTTGFGNTATGVQALFSNTGDDNTAVGWHALSSLTGGNGSNVAIGAGALSSLTSGISNVGIGGTGSLTTGSENIYISVPANGITTESNTIRIGDIFQTQTFIGGIWNTNEGGSNMEAVYINSGGRLGTQAPPSSRRFKEEIKPMDKISEAILSFKPVTFQYKSDTKGTPQFGLIAEEVAEANPDLVTRDDKGEIYGVRYDAVNAMLLNEFLKEYRRVEEQGRELQDQKAINAELRSALASVNERLKQQDAKINKMNAKVELAKPQPQMVENR